MSGTKSAFPMAPATKAPPAALIVAHGQPSNPAAAEAALKKLAGQVNLRLPDWEIDSATMAAKGALQQARLRHPAAAIYPLFMADGWFTSTALPERLIERDQNDLLPPLGMDPRLPAIALEVLMLQLATQEWQMSKTCLIIAAHGGRNSKNPARAAREFTEAIRDISNFADVRLGFIEEQPDLSDIAMNAGKCAICLPFFASNGLHVRDDIPTALKNAGFEGVILDAIGVDAQIPDLIAQSLKRAVRQ